MSHCIQHWPALSCCHGRRLPVRGGGGQARRRAPDGGAAGRQIPGQASLACLAPRGPAGAALVPEQAALGTASQTTGGAPPHVVAPWVRQPQHVQTGVCSALWCHLKARGDPGGAHPQPRAQCHIAGPRLVAAAGMRTGVASGGEGGTKPPHLERCSPSADLEPFCNDSATLTNGSLEQVPGLTKEWRRARVI